MLNRYGIRAALLATALFSTIACSDHDGITGPGTSERETIALVELEGTRPAFYIQKADGSARARIHFTGAVDEVPGNSPLVPALTDANILAIRSVKWSPDGSRIAFVATVAADQAEVVVMKADGSDARIVSPNYAYVLGDVDWSPDGARVAYIMATQPGLRGLELFVSDVGAAPRVTKVTTNSGYRGLGGTIRFASNGTAVWISQVTGEGGGPLFESVGAVRRVELATGAVSSVLENIVGEVQAVAHSGAYAIVLRRKSVTNGVYDSQIVRVPIGATGGGEQVLVDGGQLDYARLTTDDARVLVLRNGSSFSALGPFGGTAWSVRGSGAEPLSADVKP
jgi:dipeptidyl aminopeptidase/acylaminoacyl peptidase